MIKPVVIVTGGGSGIGRATAQRFAREGYAVVIAGRTSQTGEAVAAAINQGGSDAVFVKMDVALEADCQAMAAVAVERWGRIDVLVANAGVQERGELLAATEANWDLTLGVNLKGVAYSCRAVLPHMINGGGGAIVMTSSINALIGCPDMAIYDVSKAALLALTRTLACRHGGDGIRVNAICPGGTVTDFHERRAAARGLTPAEFRESVKGYGLIGRPGEPEEIASVIYFLASREAAFITGQAIVADGGASVILAR